jgi:ferric-dicitrate binding protein FerR (iron transport regulator)
MNYNDYTEEDFILDESFYNWVFRKNEQDCIFWENWIASHPHKKETIESAGRFLKHLQLQENTFTDQDSLESWQLIQTKLHTAKEDLSVNHSITIPRTTFISRHWQKMAAVFVGLLLVSVFVLLPKEKIITYQTAFGETRNIVLPDSSVITLNANSTLTYSSQWNSSKAREVWLEGEAFLQVVKKPGAADARFVVHTDKLDVEVLGTAFNVNNRRGKTKVVLNSGKVKLLTEASDDPKSLVMVPGDLVEFSEEAKAFTRKKVNPEVYSSWRNHKLYFADHTLQEIAQVLEDNYGLEIQIQDAQLRERKLTGEVPSTDEQTVLEVLSESLNIRFTKDGRKVILQHK